MPSESVASAFCRKALRLNPYSIGTHSPSAFVAGFESGSKRSQSLFYWNTLSEESKVNESNSDAESQSLFYWNTLSERTIGRPWRESLPSQSLFYWNTLSESRRDAGRGIFRGLNPYSIGTHSPRPKSRRVEEWAIKSQSLFYWNTLSEYKSRDLQDLLDLSQSLFYWNTLSERQMVAPT